MIDKSTLLNALLRIRFWGGLLCIILLTAGCQFGPKEKSVKWPWKKDEAKPLPERLLPVWTDSVLHQPNQPGVRGFGGRIYFYAKDDTDPIEVDGSLAVYVFDADDIEANSQRPLRKYIFTADQFNEHMSKTSIGPSYSIWLPWGEVGGPPRRLSLIARFEGREGGTTISDPTIKLLPGVPKKEHSENGDEQATDSSDTPFRLSSHLNQRGAKKKDENEVESNEKDSEEAKRSDIKTIDLPPSFQRHLRGTPLNPTQPATVDAPNAMSTAPNDSKESLQTDTTVQVDASGSNSEIESPMTTQVIDYRTRRKQGAARTEAAKNDIRQGRWIESIDRK